MALTPTGVRKINENVLQEKRAMILTDKDASNYDFSSLPDGTILIDTKTGHKSIKLEGQSDWISDPAELKQDNTVCIIKDSKIEQETFTIVSIDTEKKEFVYANTEGEHRTKPITDDGGFTFEVEKGTYIPHRNHLTVMIDGILMRTESAGDLEELTDFRFVLKSDTLVVGQTVEAQYIVWMRIGNPYPRFFLNKNEPEDGEIGDFWLDMDAALEDGDIKGDDYWGGDGDINWNRIVNTPTTLNGYGITDKVSYEGHKHTVNDITDIDSITKNISVKNSDTVGYHKPGTDANDVLVIGADGKIPQTVIPNIMSLLPHGMIIDWYGTADTIPSGWALCNGLNGTPDLRGRMTICVNDSHPFKQTGGSESESLSIQQIPSHGHDGKTTGADNVIGKFSATVRPGYGKYRNGNGIVTVESREDSKIGGGDHDTDWVTNYAINIGKISYSIKTNNTGGNQPHNNMPPYYAIYKIMKL